MPEDLHRHATLVDQREPQRPRTVRARHAASLLVWREAGETTEILMGMRGARHRFMPDRLVFPGGAVDRADLAAPLATGLSVRTQAALRRNANASLAHGLGVAAARELQEETGLSLGSPPALDGLDYLARAVTPTDSPIQFNARSSLYPCLTCHRHFGRRRRTGQFALLWHYRSSVARPRGPDTPDAGAIENVADLKRSGTRRTHPRPGVEGPWLATGMTWRWRKERILISCVGLPVNARWSGPDRLIRGELGWSVSL